METMQQNGYPPRREVARLSTFELAGKVFGLDILKSREVIPLPHYTPLPNSNEIFYGVFNLRGEIFPLVDISPILGLAPKKAGVEDMVILVENDPEFIIGVLVDRLHRVAPYTPGELKSPKGFASRELSRYTSGILQNGNQTIHVLDLDSVFRAKEILAHY